MLAAVTRSSGEMVIEDVPEPGPPRAGNVILRPEAVGICGSDFHLFSGDLGALSGARHFYPRIQGHEVSAIVTDVGEAVTGGAVTGGAVTGGAVTGGAVTGGAATGDGSAISPGDRVAVWPLLPCGHCYPCRVGRPNVCPQFRLVGVHLDGGLQERLEVPAGLVFKVGDLDPDCTAFVEPASIAVHALARGRLEPGEQAVVFGAGPIGLATTLAAAAAGARVTTIDPIPARRDLARQLGAERVTWAPAEIVKNEIRDATGGEGPSLVVETSGETTVLPDAVDMVSAAGRVVVVGMSSATAPIRPGAFPEKEIDVIGSSCATADDFSAAINLVSANRASLSALFSHHFPLTRAAEAFEFAMKRPPDAIKIVVTVN